MQSAIRERGEREKGRGNRHLIKTSSEALDFFILSFIIRGKEK